MNVQEDERVQLFQPRHEPAEVLLASNESGAPSTPADTQGPLVSVRHARCSICKSSYPLQGFTMTSSYPPHTNGFSVVLHYKWRKNFHRKNFDQLPPHPTPPEGDLLHSNNSLTPARPRPTKLTVHPHLLTGLCNGWQSSTFLLFISHKKIKLLN